MTLTLELEEVRCCVCGSEEGTILASGKDYEYRTCTNTFSFKECATCGLWYLTPRPTIADLAAIYPSDYYSYDENEGRQKSLTQYVWDRLEEEKIATFRRLLGKPDTAHVFDLGCGSGRLLGLFRRFLPSVWQVSGAEVDKSAAKIAATIDDVTVHHGLFEDLDIEPESLDFVIAQQVVEHVPDPRRTIEKAFSVLRPGGLLVLETPNVRGLDRRIFSRRYWGGYHFPRHFYLFSPQTLSRLVGECGFGQMSAARLVSATFWITTIRNILSQRPRLRRMLRWVHIRNPALLGLTSALELTMRLAGAQSSNMQFIARK